MIDDRDGLREREEESGESVLTARLDDDDDEDDIIIFFFFHVFPDIFTFYNSTYTTLQKFHFFFHYPSHGVDLEIF